MTVREKYARYVSQNILGMIGISLYILADTFFISKAQGALGVAALNLVLPVFSLIFAIGAMMGVGSAIRFSIDKAMGNKGAETYFFHALLWGLLLGMFFLLLGLFIPEQILGMLGGNEEIVKVGTGYTRIIMLFAPCFMWNHICNAFVRNDGRPSIAMAATLFGSLFNIVMDYILMFPLGLGMTGAALATGFSPIVGVLVCCIHFFSKKNTVKIRFCLPSLRKLMHVCQLGVSAFVGEISSGVTTAAFNVVILQLAGNIGVAAYGVVANTALVAVSGFNGISQGAQPLLSDCYGSGDERSVHQLVKLSLSTAVVMAVLILIAAWVFTEPIIGIFNSERDVILARYADLGLRIYFVGFLFAGINIVGTGILSAVESAKKAFIASISRGFVIILICTFVLPKIFGMTGVWLAFPVAELCTCALTIPFLVRTVGKSK